KKNSALSPALTPSTRRRAEPVTATTACAGAQRATAGRSSPDGRVGVDLALIGDDIVNDNRNVAADRTAVATAGAVQAMQPILQASRRTCCAIARRSSSPAIWPSRPLPTFSPSLCAGAAFVRQDFRISQARGIVDGDVDE